MLKYILLSLLFVASFAQAQQNSRAAVTTFTRGSAGIEVKEISTVQCRADVGGNLGGKYFVIYSALNAVKYAVWYNTGSSTAPTVAGATLVSVSITASDTGDTVCTNTKTSLDGITGTPFVTTRLTDTLTITNSGYGVTTDIADVDTTHTQVVKATDGVSAADAISSASIVGNLRGFTLCNDAVNTSTYLQVGFGTVITDTSTRLNKGQCFVCGECKKGVLQTLRVSSEAATNGYGIVQFKN
jgi:hypothetical protein